MKRLRSSTLFGLVAAALIVQLFAAAVTAQPAKADAPSGCATVSLQQLHSDACLAEITANPEPKLERPTVFDPKLDGASHPRSVLLPKDPLPYEIGWMLKDWYYSDAPGIDPPAFSKDRIYAKAKVVYLFATVNIRGMDWHMVGPDRWISGEHIARLVIAKRPEGVSGQWIALDLAEQTIIAYQDDQPIFATLVSAAWIGYGVTREGLFHIEARAKNTTFRGPPWAVVPEYIYNFVPNVQFFDGNIALHGAYWHDWFGYTRSHGCVNIPVADSRWLWNWVNTTVDKWGPDKGAFHIPHPENAPWVYVYHSPRTGDTRLGT